MTLNFKSLVKGQAGFTLIEVLVAIAITGIIALGASVATGQVLDQTARNNDYTTASRNALNALYWISHDVTMAQNMDGADGFPVTDDLSLSWTAWDNTEFAVDYTLQNGVLTRSCSENGQVSTTFIAESINPDEDMTYCVIDDGTLTVTVTCSVGAGDRIVNVTKSRTIASRPKL